MPIGGCYRLIDVPMSNCINSGINKIYILTQFNSQSLNRHLARTYNLGNGVNFGDGFVEVLAATQTSGEGGKKWFQGTADAVRQFVWLFEVRGFPFISIVCKEKYFYVIIYVFSGCEAPAHREHSDTLRRPSLQNGLHGLSPGSIKRFNGILLMGLMGSWCECRGTLIRGPIYPSHVFPWTRGIFP